MISVDDALSLIASHCDLLGREDAVLDKAAGRVLAEPVVARFSAPRHAVSERDGYAVRDGDLAGEALAVAGMSRPGDPAPAALVPGATCRVLTGAPVPEGTDRVIMQEYADVGGGRVTFRDGHGPSRHIRGAASDFAAGDVLLAAGTRLTPQALVAAAAADAGTVVVAQRPRLALMVTGDELSAPGSGTGAVPDSITAMLAALGESAGASVVRRFRGRDDLDALAGEAARACAGADVVVVTGGASVGAFDFARQAFADAGASEIFSKVAMRPGRPVWFACKGGTRILGLPGNPGSALVTAALFLRPLLARLQGAGDPNVWVALPLAGGLPATGERETYVRAGWRGGGLVPVSNQDSGAQAALAGAGWLVRRPAGGGPAGPRDLVEACLL